jgi:hypothetical protein
MLNRKTFLPSNKYLFSLLISIILHMCVISISSAGTVEQRIALYTSGESAVSSAVFSNLDEPLIIEREWVKENKNILEVGTQKSNTLGPNIIMCMFFAIAFLILRRKEPAPKRKDDGLSE